MQIRKTKFILLAILLIFVLFFTNDLGLIDVEKTSIITAIAIDKDDKDYTVTAQIAVPEATDTNSENQKAEISGKGSTIGAALKDLGDTSGWFPKLAFCNLIILGDSLSETNVIKVLDYFAKTLRVQDSALVALCDKSAKEILSLATPLDNISSFAIQKIMLKNIGFDRDISSTDIKTFCSGHYSKSGSAYMPLIKSIPAKDSSSSSESSSGGGSSSQEMTGGNQGGGSSGSSDSANKQKNNLFDARTTALFKNGYKVGQLDEKLSLTFNAFGPSFNGTTLPIDDVPYGSEMANYLLTVLNKISSVKLSATENDLTLDLKLYLYCKVSDVNVGNSNAALSENQPLPPEVKLKAENELKKDIDELILTIKNTECDIFNLKEKLYRHNYKQYSRYKDNYLSVLKVNADVKVYGQE